MPAPEGALLHEWLRRTATAQPEALALLEDERSLTFAELYTRSTHLAACWLRHGIRRGDRIALSMPKNIEAVTAVFAALQMGAICVPLHPRWPRERIESVTKDCEARLLIVFAENEFYQKDLLTGDRIPWPSFTEIQADDLAADLALLATVDDRDTEEIALLLFTSGSTGQPKGVALSHCAIASFVCWTAEIFAISSGDRLGCPSPLGFDLSTFDLFNMALTGATAVLIPDNIVWMPRFLTQYLRQTAITCWYSVPSILTGMMRDGRMQEADFPSLRLLLFAGEVFPAPALAELMRRLPDVRFVNLYGPTETNVVTWYEVPSDYDGSEDIPIGIPCPYAQIRLDETNGELLAGGASLMHGYWNREEETARHITRIDTTTWYRTGDRAALSECGHYLYLGRLDRQVKRRGFRIELDEIESALVTHPDILEAAVVLVQDAQQPSHIVAFVRKCEEAEPSTASIKAYTMHRLPSYMLPDEVHVIREIAKNTRGKTDYIALSHLAKGWKSGN